MVDYRGFIGTVRERAHLAHEDVERAARRTARPLALDTFLALIADREGVDRGQAGEHARAVFDVLRDVVGEDEFHDTTDQFPGEYRVLLRRG